MFDRMMVHETARVNERYGTTPPTPGPSRAPQLAASDWALICFHNFHVVPASAQSSNNACTSVKDSCLITSMKALGLASHAATSHQPADMTAARGWYTLAISEVNQALQGSESARKDSTLYAVIVLSYFENITGSETSSFEAWSNHIHGTAALIGSRAVDQVRTSDGRMLFMIASTNMISNCMRLSIPFPRIVHEVWRDGMQRYLTASDPLFRNHAAWLRIVDLHSQVTNGRVDVENVVPEALDIDRELLLAFSTTPTQDAYDILPLPQECAGYGMPLYAHYFRREIVAQVWSTMRCGRLVLHRAIIAVVEAARALSSTTEPSPWDDQIRESKEVIDQVSLAILAAVPYYLGVPAPPVVATTRSPNPTAVPPDPTTEMAPPPSAAPESSGKRPDRVRSIDSLNLLPLESDAFPMLKTARGYVFLWNLATIANYNGPGHPSTSVVCRHIRALGQKLGVHHAFMMADKLEQGEVVR